MEITEKKEDLHSGQMCSGSISSPSLSLSDSYKTTSHCCDAINENVVRIKYINELCTFSWYFVGVAVGEKESAVSAQVS